MRSKVSAECQYISKAYHEGFEEIAEADDTKEFMRLFEQWKKSESVDEKQKQKWLQSMDQWIFAMGNCLLSKKRPKHYEETVSSIAAYGELLEAYGCVRAKQKYMQKYVDLFPSRRRFHEELDRYLRG